jgi:hypothetical protein
MSNIPNPLRTGTYDLANDSYTGDVGSLPKDPSPATLNLGGNATATVTVEGIGDPLGVGISSQFHTGTFNVNGDGNTLFLNAIGGGLQSGYGPGRATVNLAPGAWLHGAYTVASDGFLTVNCDKTTALLNTNVVGHGGSVDIGAPIVGSGPGGGGTFTLGGDAHGGSTQVALGAAVDSSETFTLNSGHLTLNDPGQFAGTVNWIPTGDARDQLDISGLDPTSYAWDGNFLNFSGGPHGAYSIKVGFPADRTAYVYSTPAGVELQDRNLQGAGLTPIPERVTGVSGMTIGPQNFVANDGSASSIIAGKPYSGPVAGLQNEVITPNQGNLNISAISPNSFIHTGAGTDGISFASSGGNNVADGGTGSNFMTGGSGNDTFFDDARGATSDIWNTISNFHPGDSATLWGVTPSDFNYVWAPSDGAVGFQGLTLHAFSKTGGANASVTFAGKTMSDLATMSVVQDQQTGYTYVHAN